MDAQPAIQPPRTAYAGLMAATACVSVVGAYVAASLVEGDARAAAFAAVTVAGASLCSFLPVLIQTRSGAAGFGVLIFAASIARMLLLMVGVLAVDNAGTVAQRPFVLGVLVGAAISLVFETAAAVVILKKLDRAGAHRAGATSHHSEHA